MTREEAIKVLERAEGYIGIHYINGVEDPYINPCLLKSIDFAISALREQEQWRWIPVTERVPDYSVPSTFYLCYWNGYIRVCKYWRTRNVFELRGKKVNVTHWMPLPESPKEVE